VKKVLLLNFNIVKLLDENTVDTNTTSQWSSSVSAVRAPVPQELSVCVFFVINFSKMPFFLGLIKFLKEKSFSED